MSGSILITAITSVAFGFTALYVAIARRHRPAWKAGVVELLGCCFITLAHVLQVTHPDYGAKVFWYKMTYVGFTITPTTFLWLALVYCGLDSLLTLRKRLGMLLIPLVSTGIILTNEQHGLMWNPDRTAAIVNSDSFLSVSEAGIGYWIFVTYSFFMMGLGCYFLARMLFHSRSIYGWQVSAIFIAGIMAMLGCTLDIFGVSPLPSFSMTALGLAIGSITVAYVLAPFRRRDMTLVTRTAIFNSISDSIIVLDGDDQIVDINPSAEKLIGKPASQVNGKFLDKFSPELKLVWNCMANNNSEVTFVYKNAPHTFDLGVSIIHEKTQFMQQLIDDILLLSRSGRVEMRISQIDMEGLAHTVYQELTSPKERERIEFHVVTLPQAFGDYNLIHQVWANLLSNAIKYSAIRERAIIQVTGSETNDEIIFSVKDNGAGFNMDYVDRIFNAFQRLHSVREFPGTGVGLAIVQRVILRHEGRVWAEGKDDQGATFYFSLPKKRK